MAGKLTAILRKAAVAAILMLPSLPGFADLVGHGAPVRDIVISSDGKTAVTSAFDDMLILWDLDSQSEQLAFVGHGAAVNAAAFLPHRIASVSDDGTLRLWDRETAKLRKTISAHDKKAVTVAASADGRYIATGSWDRTVKVWNADTGALVRVFDRHRNNINAVQFSPSGDFVYSAGYDGAIWVWPVIGDTDPRRLTEKDFPVNDMALSADGKTLITGSSDGFIRLWDTASGTLQREVKGHEGSILAVAISPSGNAFASGSTDGFILIWESGDEPKQKLPVEYYRAVWSLEFSPDGSSIYAAGIDKVARGWRVSDGKPVAGETTPFQPVDRVAADLANSDDPVERGSFHFRKCAICHSLADDGTRRSGPSLENIFGRKVGSYPGYHYSEALRNSYIIWTEETISKLFELGPDVLLPGTKMPLQKLPKSEDRQALIEFLKVYTNPTPDRAQQ